MTRVDPHSKPSGTALIVGECPCWLSVFGQRWCSQSFASGVRLVRWLGHRQRSLSSMSKVTWLRWLLHSRQQACVLLSLGGPALTIQPGERSLLYLYSLVTAAFPCENPAFGWGVAASALCYQVRIEDSVSPSLCRVVGSAWCSVCG